jgi:hypothetical protein
MNLAFPIQFLKPGKALCSAAFPNLCATWNWMASALSNLKGDHDFNQNDGHISVDWTAPDHPVIRCVNCKAKSGGGGSSEITVVGTDGVEAVCTTGKITFASASDSNVEVKATADTDGNVTITVGVYYA